MRSDLAGGRALLVVAVFMLGLAAVTPVGAFGEPDPGVRPTGQDAAGPQCRSTVAAGSARQPCEPVLPASRLTRNTPDPPGQSDPSATPKPTKTPKPSDPPGQSDPSATPKPTKTPKPSATAAAPTEPPTPASGDVSRSPAPVTTLRPVPTSSPTGLPPSPPPGASPARGVSAPPPRAPTPAVAVPSVATDQHGSQATSRDAATATPSATMRPSSPAAAGMNRPSHPPFVTQPAVFSVPEASSEALRGVPLVAVASFGDIAFDWLVPAMTLSVPGVLIVSSVALQALGGALWLPAIRRRLRLPGRRTARTSPH
jgi:hypothetical protein